VSLSFDVSSLASQSLDFWYKIEAVKNSILDPGFTWYPYYSLGNLEHFEQLLTGSRRDLRELLLSGKILDIGCADGDFAFFLESIGCQVQAVDFPATNINEMRGVRKLKEVLDSNIEIFELNLDGPFELPQRRYGLVCLLGVLYHLKNPVLVLEKLALHCRYCLLSTRIASHSPNGTPLSGEPVAYLLDPSELNADPTNFWIFSGPGLRRLLERTRWEIVDYATIGAAGSDPNSLENDQRAFCLLRSRVHLTNVRLVEGFHEEEESGWRWTAGRFAFEIPLDANARRFGFDVYLPEAIFDRLGPLTLNVQVTGTPLPSLAMPSPGMYPYDGDIPASAMQEPYVVCTLDRCLPPQPPEQRELGVIVTEIRFGM